MFSQAITTVDIDNDGDIDVLVCGDGFFAILENRVDNDAIALRFEYHHFSPQGTDGEACRQIFARDVNRDSRMDIIMFLHNDIRTHQSLCGELACSDEFHFEELSFASLDAFLDFGDIDVLHGDVGNLNNDDSSIDFTIVVRESSGQTSMRTYYVEFGDTTIRSLRDVGGASRNYTSLTIASGPSESDVTLLATSIDSRALSMFGLDSTTTTSPDAIGRDYVLYADVFVDGFGLPQYAVMSDLGTPGEVSDIVTVGDQLHAFILIDGVYVAAPIADAGAMPPYVALGDLDVDFEAVYSYTDVVAVVENVGLVWYQNTGGRTFDVRCF